MTATGPELISHPLCPFNQRFVIALLKNGKRRGEDFAVTYVDIGALPDWFTSLLPDGPAFPTSRQGGRVSGDAGAIFEYLDESSGGSLFRGTAAERLVLREWLARVDDLMHGLRAVFTAGTRDAIEPALATVFEKLAAFEAADPALVSTLNGREFSAVDAAMAPFFSLILQSRALRSHDAWRDLPGVRKWGDGLLADDEVGRSRCPNPAAEFIRFFEITGGVFGAEYG